MSEDELLAELQKREPRVEWRISYMHGEEWRPYRYIVLGYKQTYGEAYLVSLRSLGDAIKAGALINIAVAKAQRLIAAVTTNEPFPPLTSDDYIA